MMFSTRCTPALLWWANAPVLRPQSKSFERPRMSWQSALAHLGLCGVRRPLTAKPVAWRKSEASGATGLLRTRDYGPARARGQGGASPGPRAKSRCCLGYRLCLFLICGSKRRSKSRRRAGWPNGASEERGGGGSVASRAPPLQAAPTDATSSKRSARCER